MYSRKDYEKLKGTLILYDLENKISTENMKKVREVIMTFKLDILEKEFKILMRYYFVFKHYTLY